jgi:branched-chain amino acid transport system substrate-binding protein
MRCCRHFKALLCIIVFLAMTPFAHATQGVTDKEIIIGTHTALSGPVAGWGIEASNAVRMRFEEANEAGGIHGRKIQYIVEDSQYHTATAVQRANKLINRDQVFALIASIGTPMNNAVFSMQFAKNVPSLFPYTLARSMVEPHHPLKFQLPSTYYDQTRAGVKYFVEEKGKKNVCIMHIDTEYGEEILDGVQDQLKVHNMELTARTTHKAEDTNFVPHITRLRNAGCDLVVQGTIIRDTILSASTARNMGWDVTMFGASASCNSVVPVSGGPAMEGLYGVSGLTYVTIDEVGGRGRAFFEKYHARYGNYPTEVGQFGYMAADLTVVALQNAGRALTVESFVKGMQAIKDYENMFGGPNISFGPEQHKGSNESVLIWIKDGRWVYPDGVRRVLSH